MDKATYNISEAAACVTVNETRYRPLGKRLIDTVELALRLDLPESWIREQVRRRATDPLPYFRMGKYVRFDWDSSELQDWITRRLVHPVSETNCSKRKQMIQ